MHFVSRGVGGMKLDLKNAKILLLMYEQNHTIETISEVPPELVPLVVQSLRNTATQIENGSFVS